MTGWKPIDTAPNEGLRTPRIDLWVDEPGVGGYRVPDAFWHKGVWKITIQLGFRITAFPAWHTATNWRLRPAPPDDYSGPVRPSQ